LLKVRTGYSFRQAAGKIEDVLSRLQEVGSSYAPITDRASTFGFYRWKKAAEKVGLKPVFGVELAVTPSANAPKPVVDFWTFTAKDDLGPINRLVELATTQFRYQPLLTLEQALAAEGVNKMAGHRPQLDWESGPTGGVGIMLGPSSPRGVIKQALAHGWPLIASSDNRYPREGDRGFYEVLVGRNAESQSYAQHILSPDEWRASIAHHGLSNFETDKALVNAAFYANDCNVTLQRANLPHPVRPDTLEGMCRTGAAKLGCDLSNPAYEARLKRELELIAVKGYEDYFYIVADICSWARSRMIVGPARGSSCGSLVCYLLGITTVDPIPFGLIFERFIDINRNDMPDIDIDFSDQQRYMVFDYVNEKYGSDKVARLGTVAMFQPRSALVEVGSALRLPKWKCDAVAESLIERSSGDSRALQTLEDTLTAMPAGKTLIGDHPEAMVVTKFEGHPRHHSQHAAGIVIAERPITDFVAVDHRTGATMCDKKDAEDGYNLLKIDALGLTQLSVFEDCLALAGLPRDHLETLPLEDQAAFDVLNKAQWSGIFQWNGMALQSITKQFKVTKFDDIVSVTALGRPGPLASGGAHEWIRRRNGTNPVSYPHPIFRPYMEDTLGIVLYQEQVMEIGRNIGDLDWGQVTALRKAMSKSLGKEYFDQFGDPWKKGAISKGVDPVAADKIWDDLCAYGAWSFNKSHSVAYGLISYWCCWLKAHFPFEFAAATLSHEDDPGKQIKLLREMVAEGYEYVPVDAELSDRKWTVGQRDGKRVLIGPLSNVKGIGPKMVSQIVGARARGERITDRARKLLEGAKTPIDSLWPIRDNIKRIMPDPIERNIVTHPTPIIDVQIEAETYDVLVFCTLTKINPRDENEVVMIARRGYEIKDGMTQSLNLQLTDDTDTIFGKIDRWAYARMGQEIVDRGRVGKALYAIKGTVRGGSSFRMISIKMVRYLGDIADTEEKKYDDKRKAAGGKREDDQRADETDWAAAVEAAGAAEGD
jgi:DNA polymerase III alpha subunit